jgi:cysteine desulfurase/selenocysteine lyase
MSTALAQPGDFPAAARCTYLNSASVALMYKGAEAAVLDWQKDVADYGTLNFDEEAEDRVFDTLREAFAGLIGAEAQDVAVAASATELIASLAWAVAPAADKNIVAVDVVFPSTVYPWARVARHTGCEMRWVKARDALATEEDVIAAIDGNTAVVCLSHVEYGGGQRWDLARICQAAHANGAIVVVDATQSLGAVSFDIAREPVDALISGSYKWMCGPFGVGVMYLRRELAARLDPGIVGWRSNSSIYSLQADRIEYAPNARRFEFSTMSYGCALGLERSIRHLRKVGIEAIHAHNLALGARMIEGLRGLGAEIVSPVEGFARTSIVSARFPGLESKAVVRALGERKIIVSPRRDFVRLSFHLYNTDADVDTATEALREIIG